MFRLFRALDANRRNLTDHNIWRKDQTKVCVAVCRSKKLPRQLRPIAGFLQQKFFLNKIYFSLAQEPQEQHKCRLFETCIFAPKIVARLFFLLAFLPVLFAFLPQLLPLSRFALICLRGIILYTKIFSCGSTSKAYKINIFHCIYWLNVKAFGIHLFFSVSSVVAIDRSRVWCRFYNHLFCSICSQCFSGFLHKANYRLKIFATNTNTSISRRLPLERFNLRILSKLKKNLMNIKGAQIDVACNLNMRLHENPLIKHQFEAVF